jgi:hypothetical protein
MDRWLKTMGSKLKMDLKPLFSLASHEAEPKAKRKRKGGFTDEELLEDARGVSRETTGHLMNDRRLLEPDDVPAPLMYGRGPGTSSLDHGLFALQ